MQYSSFLNRQGLCVFIIHRAEQDGEFYRRFLPRKRRFTTRPYPMPTRNPTMATHIISFGV